jgi:hypothetical protein
MNVRWWYKCIILKKQIKGKMYLSLYFVEFLPYQKMLQISIADINGGPYFKMYTNCFPHWAVFEKLLGSNVTVQSVLIICIFT